MIQTKKLTPLAFGYRVTSRRPPQPELSIVVRAKLVCAPGETCTLVREPLEDGGEREQDPQVDAELTAAEYVLGQGPLTADVFEEGDDAREGQVVYPGDFAEFKPGAEVMVRATCYPPEGKADTCVVGFELQSRDEERLLAKQLQVVGPRVWVDRLLGGKHTEPLPFSSMAVDYQHAFGGPGYPANPVGRGHRSKETATEEQEDGEHDKLRSRELPNIEDPRYPAAAGDPPVPAGFGPINSEWPQRRRKVGKNWGEEYEKTRAPWYASDYDWTHQCSAPDDQQLEGYLKGDEVLRFVNLHSEAAVFSVRLPGYRPRVFVQLAGGERREVKVVCDTLFADLEEGFVYVSWRGLTPVQEDDLSDVAFLLIAHENAHDEPRPASHYLDKLAAFGEDPAGLKDSPVAVLETFDQALDSGELERRLDELDDEEDPVVAVFGDLMALGPSGADTGDFIAEHNRKAADADPNARPALIAMLKQQLRDMREAGGGGGGAPLDPETGELALGSMMRSVLGKMSQLQKEAVEAGGDFSDTNEMLEQGLAKADIPGASPDDLKVPDAAAPPPEPRPEADFSGQDLTDRDWSGLDLHGCNFEGATLTRAQLQGCDLHGARFAAAALNGTNLREANCRGASFEMARLMKTDGRGADLSGANLDQCTMLKCDLSGATLRQAHGKAIMAHKATLDDIDADEVVFEKATFDEMSMAGASFRKASLPYTLYRRVQLAKARFDGADLANTAFFECNLEGSFFLEARGDTTNFKDTSLRRADFRYAAFPSGIFMGVDAVGACFDATHLPQARFYRAVLREASFEQANLFKADMRKSSLQDARFVSANLYGSAFMEAYGTGVDLADANLKMSNFKRNKLVEK